MINSLSPSVTAAGGDRSSLVDQLVRRADVNRDGAVTSTEFMTFLDDLVQSLDRDRAAEASTPSSPMAAAPAPAAAEAAAPLSRAQAETLLRQAFEPLTRHR